MKLKAFSLDSRMYVSAFQGRTDAELCQFLCANREHLPLAKNQYYKAEYENMGTNLTLTVLTSSGAIRLNIYITEKTVSAVHIEEAMKCNCAMELRSISGFAFLDRRDAVGEVPEPVMGRQGLRKIMCLLLATAQIDIPEATV